MEAKRTSPHRATPSVRVTLANGVDSHAEQEVNVLRAEWWQPSQVAVMKAEDTG